LNLEFAKSKAKKLLVFAELICDLRHTDEDTEPSDSLPIESLFLISMPDPWYGYILLYLQTQRLQPNISCDERPRIRHHSKRYLIIGDNLYHCGIDIVLRCFLTHAEAEQVLNDYHLGACGSHLSGMTTTQFVLCAGYFCLSIFKDCIDAIEKFPPCHIFQKKRRTHLAPLHPIFVVDPFSKWGIDFMQCNPTSARGNGYMIVVIDYFTKWVEVIPTFLNDGQNATLFVFNHIIA
jgi:hypothetical protein